MNTQRGSVLLVILIALTVAAVGGAVYVSVKNSAPGDTLVVIEPPADDSCVCTKQYDPVCGIDDKTYGNACTAACAKVAVKSAGECAVPSPQPIPVPEPDRCVCTMQYDPVCGADGKTYGNACSAACAKVAVTSRGECQEPVSGTASDPAACAAVSTACEANACRFSNGVCDMNEKSACQTNYQTCVRKLPQTCFYSYNNCLQANSSRVPCPAEGCAPQRDCLAEYKVCAKNPPALTGVCAETIQKVCFAGPSKGDDIVRTCEDGTYVYQKTDGTQYHGTLNYCN